MLVFRALRYHLDAHASTPVNFGAAVLGMLINNTIFVYGMWLMLFAGKEGNRADLPYFMALWGITCFTFGMITFVLGGFFRMGNAIDEGALDPMLATPRHPLLLVGLSQSNPTALGDALQGVLVLALLPLIAPLDFCLRAVAILVATTMAFVGAMIAAGSLAFFVQRGAAVGDFLIEAVLSLSIYPSGRIFDGGMRWLVYLTPALLTSILPLEAVSTASPWAFLGAICGSAAFLAASVGLFQLGLKRYRSGNLVGVAR